MVVKYNQNTKLQRVSNLFFVWNHSGTAVSTFHWFPVQAMLQCHGPCWLVFSKASTLQNRYFAEVVYVLGLVGIDRNANVRECHLLLQVLYAECWWLLELYSVTVPKFWNLQNSWYVSFQDEVKIPASWKFLNTQRCNTLQQLEVVWPMLEGRIRWCTRWWCRVMCQEYLCVGAFPGGTILMQVYYFMSRIHHENTTLTYHLPWGSDGPTVQFKHVCFDSERFPKLTFTYFHHVFPTGCST